MITETLIDNLIHTNFNDLPEETLKEAKRSLLNWAGVAIGAAEHESMDKVFKVAKLTGGSKECTVLGRKEKADLLFAALLNGMSSHIFDFDDTLLDTVLHPSAPVFPAILAYAEKYGLTGKDVLGAFIVGCEVEARLAKALYPSHYWRGWHITGTTGTIGAAAAVAKLQNLDHKRYSYAIGLAATEPTGLREMFGTMTKPFHPGKAAMNGLMASLLAEQGFTSSERALEAKRGYSAVLSDESKLDILTTGWAETWEILKNSYKPYASGIVTHPAIFGAISAKEKYQIDPEQIASIDLDAHPLVQELTGKTSPQTGLEGKFSVYHCVAAGLFDDKAGVEQFTDERVIEKKVVELRGKINLNVNERIKEDQVNIKIKMIDGSVYETFIEHALGSIDMPMTDHQLEEKFRDVTQNMISDEKQTKIIEMINDFEYLDDLALFFDLCH